MVPTEVGVRRDVSCVMVPSSNKLPPNHPRVHTQASQLFSGPHVCTFVGVRVHFTSVQMPAPRFPGHPPTAGWTQAQSCTFLSRQTCSPRSRGDSRGSSQQNGSAGNAGEGAGPEVGSSCGFGVVTAGRAEGLDLVGLLWLSGPPRLGFEERLWAGVHSLANAPVASEPTHPTLH